MKRKPRARSYGYDTVLVLHRVRVIARQPCENPVQVRYAFTPTVNGSSKNKTTKWAAQALAEFQHPFPCPVAAWAALDPTGHGQHQGNTKAVMSGTHTGSKSRAACVRHTVRGIWNVQQPVLAICSSEAGVSCRGQACGNR